MFTLPAELINIILYFTSNPVTELSLISKYFDYHTKRIRITGNIKYRIRDEHLPLLPNLTDLFFKVLTIQSLMQDYLM